MFWKLIEMRMILRALRASDFSAPVAKKMSIILPSSWISSCSFRKSLGFPFTKLWIAETSTSFIGLSFSVSWINILGKVWIYLCYSKIWSFMILFSEPANTVSKSIAAYLSSLPTLLSSFFMTTDNSWRSDSCYFIKYSTFLSDTQSEDSWQMNFKTLRTLALCTG